MNANKAEQQWRDSLSFADSCFMLSGLIMIGLVLVNDWPLVIDFLLHRNW